MDSATLHHVIEYVEEQNVSVQLTHTNGDWTADFQNDIHARVCYEELIADNHVVSLQPSGALRILRLA